MDRKKYDLKPYRRGQIVFKIGLLVFLTIPPSIMYYKRYQKEIFAQGMINDMKRMGENGRSIHDVPRYKTAARNDKVLKRNFDE